MGIKKWISDWLGEEHREGIKKDSNRIMLNVEKGREILLKDNTFGYFEGFNDGDNDFLININGEIVSRNVNEIRCFISKIKGVGCPACKSERFERGNVSAWNGSATRFNPEVKATECSAVVGWRKLIAYRCVNCGNYMFFDK